MQTGNDCPWYPASADCWEVEDDGQRVKFVMERWLPAHYEARPFVGASFNLRAGFIVQTADELGRLVSHEVIGDEIEVPLFDSAVKIMTGLSLMTVLALST